MQDVIMRSWLERQSEEGLRLASASDVLVLKGGSESPPREFLAHFDCPTLIRMEGEIIEHVGFDVLIRFPSDYLRRAPDPALVVALLSPQNAYHPNVAPPFLCIGSIAPGTSLCELVYRIYEILTFQKLTPSEHDALNREACSWARTHMDRFPLNSRALRRREISLDVTEIIAEASP